MTYIVAAMVASGIFIVAAWRTKQDVELAPPLGGNIYAADPLWGEPEIDLSTPIQFADVGAAMRQALKRLTPMLRNQSVQAEFVLPTGLVARMRGAALTDLLEELLGAAIQSAPASRMLLTATRLGDGIYVRITDDMPSADLTVRVESVRNLQQRVAMRGGALDIIVRPHEGATMTLRLAAVIEQETPAHALSGFAKGPAAAPSIRSMGSEPQLR